MIDSQCNVRRYIAEYSEKTDVLLANYELDTFSLKEFQAEFKAHDGEPMFDCYPIRQSNIEFLSKHVLTEPNWDFVTKAYFLEAHAV